MMDTRRHSHLPRVSASAGDNGASTIHTIQLLRGVAALLVVFWHAQLMVPQFPKLVPYFFGNAGVYLFFAISGFLMVHVTDSREQRAGDFLKARVIRVVPIYWFYILGTALLMLLSPSLFRGNELSLRHLVLSLLFVPHTTTTDPGNFLPMVRVGWTLIYEAFFYTLFAAAIAVSFRHRALICGVVLTALTLLHLSLDPSITRLFPLYVYGDPIILQFVIGMGIAHALKRWTLSRLSPLHFVVVIVLAAAAMQAGDAVEDKTSLVRIALYGLPSAFVLICGLLVVDQQRFKRPVVALLGDASYSIYLVHMLPLALMRWLWSFLKLPTDGVAWGLGFIAIATGLAAVCGIVSYRLVERPLTRRLKPRPAR